MLLPIVIAFLFVPFFGSAPLGVIAIIYSHLFAWPFEVSNDLGGQVDYARTIERSSPLECYHILVSLEVDVQSQPFAVSDQDYDWQPKVSGSSEAQPTGQEAWIATPIPKEHLKLRKWEMLKCGLSPDAVRVVENAMTHPGSWIAYSPRGMDTVLVYSKPQQLALVFPNET
jgi:hypothetical protein